MLNGKINQFYPTEMMYRGAKDDFVRPDQNTLPHSFMTRFTNLNVGLT